MEVLLLPFSFLLETLSCHLESLTETLCPLGLASYSTDQHYFPYVVCTDYSSIDCFEGH